MVGQQTLNLFIEVRILSPQNSTPLGEVSHKGGAF